MVEAGIDGNPVQPRIKRGGGGVAAEALIRL